MPILSPWLNSVVFGERLASDGQELAQGVWEHAIYLGADQFIYEIEATKDGDELVFMLDHKKTIADYLRCVARRIEARGGSLDSCDCHHRATLRLAELCREKKSSRRVY